jgi:hypothetical protein
MQSTDVRQIARKPQPPIELLIVHFSRFTSIPTGDDDAPGDSPACEVGPRVVHGRHGLPVCSVAHYQQVPRKTIREHHLWCIHRGRRSGRRSSRIRSSPNAQHSTREALSSSMPHPPPPAPAPPTPPPTTHHLLLPRRRRAHPAAAQPLEGSAVGGGCSAAHMHRWPGLPGVPSTLVRYLPSSE